MQLARWRIVYSAPMNGAWNMALDEAILESMGNPGAVPVLRLYAWEPPCLSIGYSQPVADVDRAALSSRGWDLVRRPTGGRAILHTDELTYSVMAPLRDSRVAGSVLESYRRLSNALVRALELMGISVQADREYVLPEGTAPRGSVCFEVPSNYEITANGKKLIGSAQARRKEGVLQHGSLPLYGDLTRITQALVYPDGPSRQAAASRLLDHAVVLENVLGKQIDWKDAAACVTEGFRRELALEWIESEPTPAELQRAGQLVGEKFASPTWTDRV